MRFFSKKDKDEDFFFELNSDNSDKKSNGVKSPDSLTTEEILGQNLDAVPDSDDDSNALESLKKRISAVKKKEETKKENKGNSLLDKCMPYLKEEDGSDSVINSEPLYKLQSVADILKTDSEKALEKLSKNYDIIFDDLGKAASTVTKEKTVTDETEKPKEPEKEVFEETLSFTKKETPKPTAFISDIDFEPSDVPQDKSEADSLATVTFTPVSASDSSASYVNVSTNTKSIDLTNELIKIPEKIEEKSDDEMRLEQSEFEEYTPTDEFNSKEDSKKLKRILSVNKRNSFVSSFFTTIIFLALSFCKLPFMTTLLLKNTFVGMIVCTAVAFIGVLLNIDIFVSFKYLFSRKATPDICLGFASLFTLAYAVLGIISHTIVIDMLILLALILTFRSICKFYKASYILSNFNLISSSTQKKAVKLINDKAITFAMAKDAIEGDILIAAAQKTEHIADFMKYSTYNVFLSGRFSALVVASLIISVISGLFGATYFNGVFYGLYIAAAIQCLIASPLSFLIDTLPLYRASKRLNGMGAMIAGKIACEHLEMANAVVLSSNDLFPNGTVTLHQMKVLSENSLDDTLIRAASLSEYMGSTLAPIFKKIATSGNIDILPDTDTVKYEDRMGISGWVDNRLLFIGNRTLMEAHGIKVPDVEVDRKILHQGYFPVYVATRDKACALLIVQYTVNRDIVRELRNLTRIGVTVLVNNTDPNLTEEMICDYLGLYDDSVKVMSAAGCHIYKNTVYKTESTVAPAAYRGSSVGLAAIINSATKIKRSNRIFTVLYILAAVFGVLYFLYTSFSGSGALLKEVVLLLYSLIATVISYIIYLTERP